MFERLRFARYALRFERAFRTDDWDPVRACFDSEATYTVAGAGEYDGTVHGRTAIVELFRRMLDELDRKFDRRTPRLSGIPRVIDGELVVPWRVRYVLGDARVLLTGISRCRFRGGAIVALSDTMPPDEVQAWIALARRSGRSATPS